MKIDINIIQASDYGINFYADVLLTTEKMIEEKPEIVRKFVAAVIDGWKWVLAHPKESIAINKMYNEELDPEHDAAMLAESIPLIQPDPESRIGWMDRDIWTQMMNTLLDQKLIESPINIDDAFDNSFVEHYYSK